MAESTDKPKNTKFTWGTALMALFAAVTAVGDGVRSCNEREADREQAARADANRVKVDASIQTTSKKVFDDLYARIEDLEDLVDEHDAELFQCRVDNAAQDRLLNGWVEIPEDVQDTVTMEALVQETQKEDPTITTQASSKGQDAASPDTQVKATADKLVTRRRAKVPKEKPSFDFAEPEPQYQHVFDHLEVLQPEKKK